MILYIFVIFTLFFLLFRFVPALQIKSLSPWMLPTAFTLKVLVGLYFLFIYSVYYGNGELTADAGKFMNESKMLQEVFFHSKTTYLNFLFGFSEDPALVNQYLGETTHWDPGSQAIISDNRNILRLHSLIHFISFNRPSIHVIVMCFFSTLALKQFFLVFSKFSKWNDLIIFIAVLLIPSMLFWSSGILKEPMMLLGFGLFLRVLLYNDGMKKRWVLGIISILLMIGFKSYMLIALFPVLVFFLLVYLLPKWKIAGSLLIMLSGIALILLIFGNQRDELVRRMSRKQYDFISVAKGGIHAYADSLFYFFEANQFDHLLIENDSVQVKEKLTAATLQLGDVKDPGKIDLEVSDKKWRIYFMNQRCEGYLELKPINNSFSQLLKNIPQALVNTLFRPFPGDSGSWLKFPALFEIWLIWILVIIAIIKRRSLTEKQLHLLIGACIFILSLALIIGWVTPVLGAIVRYRIPILIALVFICALLSDPPKRFLRNE